MGRKRSACFLSVGLLTACGHDVTPIPSNPNGDLAGKVVVKFATSGPLDFPNVKYVIAIDSCGSGVPYPQAFVTGFSSFTYSFVVSGGFGGTAQAQLIEYYLDPSVGHLVELPLDTLTASTSQLYAPYEGQSNEFELIFPRNALNNPAGLKPACPSAAAARPDPAITPNDVTGVALPPYVTTWTFNLMTFSSDGSALDSLGVGGPTDRSFPGIAVDTTITQPYPVFRATPNGVPADLGASIVYGEVDTYAS